MLQGTGIKNMEDQMDKPEIQANMKRQTPTNVNT